jgi:hypothetical protein
MRTPLIVAAAIAFGALGLGCGGGSRHQLPVDFATQLAPNEETAPLGGTGLRQRTIELQRAHRDLVHIHDTFESLIYHDDRKGEGRLGRFAEAYMALHLDRMLSHKWQSKHPEVMGLDANLRLLKADILMKMRSEDRADRVIDDIQERYKGRESMLVDYPVGTQQSLADGLKALQQ